jgi:phospholipase C
MKNPVLALGLCLSTLAPSATALALGHSRVTATPARRAPASERAPDCSRAAGSLPDPALPAGTVDTANPVEHIVVIMQENHSFDNYFGSLDRDGYEGQVDGITPDMFNLDRSGRKVSAYHETYYCAKDPNHGWDAEHADWDSGRNDQFVRQSGRQTMGYYERTEIPYYYALADQFAIADRYFCSLLSQTFPNRFFLMTATAFGHVANDKPQHQGDFSQKTIFDLLDQYGVSWKYYSDGQGYLALFTGTAERDRARIVPLAQYDTDLQQGGLPQVSFVESNYESNEDEHPMEDVRVGQAWVARRVNALIASPYWTSSALFLTYDENGGFFDHVAPPAACAPDDIAPHLKPGSQPGAYDRYGFRVPFVAISPYAKHHYVSHVTYDHTSILKFIETRFNLPALTRRDANADGMADLFDFDHPTLGQPALPDAPQVDPTAQCTPDNG